MDADRNDHLELRRIFVVRNELRVPYGRPCLVQKRDQSGNWEDVGRYPGVEIDGPSRLVFYHERPGDTKLFLETEATITPIEARKDWE